MPPLPFPNVDFNAIAATPNRRTRVRFNTPEYRILRKHDGGHLAAYDMSPPAGISVPVQASAATGSPGKNHYVTLLPSGSWYVSSWEMMAQFERLEAIGTLMVPPDVGTPVEYAPGIEIFASLGQIPGVTYDAGAITLGCYWARKRKAASGDWHGELTSDLGAFVAPVLPTANVPMRRIAHQVTDPFSPNTPVYLRFQGPGGPLATTDAILTFYFGGDTETFWDDPSNTTSGGAFAITLFGDGEAWLMEHTNLDPGGGATLDTEYPWRRVDSFRWAVPGKIANQTHWLVFIPEGTDRLSILGTGLVGHQRGQGRGFHTNPKQCGYLRKAAVTGTGVLRLDMREDLRCPFQFGSLSFPAPGDTGSGTLYAVPFQNKFRTNAGTKITITPKTIIPAGTSINVAVYDGKTNTAITDNGDGTFSTTAAGQRAYYAVFQLNASGAFFAPFLQGYGWGIDGVSTLRTPTPFEGGQTIEVQINGSDLEIDCDSAAVLIHDEQGLLAAGAPGEGGLEAHAGFHCEIVTAYDATDSTLTTRLFEGLLVQASGLRAGRDFGGGPTAYPASNWKTWRCHMAGMWARLNESSQINWQAVDFTRDVTSGTDPETGQPYMWKIKDIIHYCLFAAGFPETQIALPGPDTRLFGNAKNTEDFWIQPGKPLGEFLHHMAKDYLGGRLIWDEAAQRWLLVYPPPLTGTYSPLWSFVTRGPTTPLAPVHVPWVYPTNTTFVENYTSFQTEPEANHFTVATFFIPGKHYGEVDEEAMKGAEIHAVIGVNWRSTDFEGYPPAIPGHPDYIPRGVKPMLIIDPCLMAPTADRTKEALRYACRRYMNAGAYGLKWFQWRAPLVLYFDPDAEYFGKPRKLRTYDVVRFVEDGTAYNVLLTSCNPNISVETGGDLHQVADMEGYVIPDPLSY